MKRISYQKSKHQVALTLLFGGIVFIVLILALLLGFIIITGLINANVIAPFTVQLTRKNLSALFGWMMLGSGLMGGVLAFVTGRFIMKPINTFIIAMNSLAGGNFKTRVYLGKNLSKLTVVNDLSESFNKMAFELEGTEMLRADFINNFSHEFKTPIVSISGFASLLRKGNLSDQERDEYLGIIETESKRLSEMATNVLNMTKIENQSILTDIQPFNISEQLRSCVLLLESKWADKNIDINMDMDEHMISGNEEMLKQVWTNLIDNAVKFTPCGGTISIRIKELAATYDILISNTGSYIQPGKIDKIFNKFYQGDESHSAQGNGIGLAIVRSVVQLHGGNVRAESKDDFTTFTVTLPKKQGDI